MEEQIPHSDLIFRMACFFRQLIQITFLGFVCPELVSAANRLDLIYTRLP